MNTPITRRQFLGATAAFAACLAVPRFASAAAGSKPCSVFNGVRIGTITYSYRGFANTADETLKETLA
jgi:hypothetical protein